jgi:hypothetical protein
MKRKTIGLLTVLLLIGPIAAIAQITTLEYQGNVMSGTSTYLPSGFVTQNPDPPLPTSPVTGTLTASIMLSGSISANDLELVSYGASFSGSNGTSFSLYAGPGPAPIVPNGPLDLCSGTGSCIDLTTAHGAITGATIDFLSNVYNGSQFEATIGPTGDSYSYLYANSNGTCEDMFYQIANSSGFYYPGRTINPCTVQVSNTRAGDWTVTRTPEIDPASAAGGLTFFLGGLVVLRGRRTREARAV